MSVLCAALARVLALALALPGCGSGSCASGVPGGGGITCTTSGGGTLTASSALKLGASIAVTAVHPCLDAGGGCTIMPSIAIQDASPDAAPPRLRVNLVLARQPAAATFAVPSADVSASASLAGEGQLSVTGTIDVESSGPGDLHATFNLEMQAADGQIITITSGHASATGCGTSRSCG